MPRKAKAPDPTALDEFGLPPLIRTETLTLLTGLSPRYLHKLVEQLRIPADCIFAGEKWRTAKTFQEIIGYYKRQADRKKPTANLNLDTENLKEDLRTKRLKNAKTARELLPRHVYVQTWGELLTVFKNRWMNFADKMAPRVFRAKDKVEAAEIMDREVRDIFAGLSDPKVMEDIARAIREDEFEHGHETDDPAGDPAAKASGHLESEDA